MVGNKFLEIKKCVVAQILCFFFVEILEDSCVKTRMLFRGGHHSCSKSCEVKVWAMEKV